jgi:predicted house-cleaning noncanonical NTP pyrophosphatase (MazG superfamily)
MLIRDLVGERIKEQLSRAIDSEFELVELKNNNEFFNAIVSKISSELESLKITKNVDNLAEIVELVDWLQIALGVSRINDLIEIRKEKLGLYWKKFYLKDKLLEDLEEETND